MFCQSKKTNFRQFSIVIPFAPDTINSVLAYGKNNWTAITNLKLKWQELAEHFLIEYIQQGKLPDRFDFPIRTTFNLYFGKNRTRDEDNYHVMTKGIQDAFTQLKMIKDDNNAFVSFGGVNFFLEPERPRVVVVVEEVFPFNIDDENGLEIIDFEELNENK